MMRSAKHSSSLSIINQITIYNISRRCSNGIHPLHPFNLIFRFQLFRNTIPFRHLFYKQVEHFFHIFVQIGKIAIQFAACQQIGLKHSSVLLDIAQAPLSPNTDWSGIFLRQYKAGDIIIALPFIPQPVLLVIDHVFLVHFLCLLHFVIYSEC